MFRYTLFGKRRIPGNTNPATIEDKLCSRPLTESTPGSKNPFRLVEEAPPPYSTSPDSQPASISPPQNLSVTRATPSSTTSTARIRSSDDDPYAFLTSFDTVFLVDDSGSMIGPRWTETKKALQCIAPICTAHDEDGIDIYFLNAKDLESYRGVKDAKTVDTIFSSVRPHGMTPTGQKLNKILKPYLALCEKNKDNLDVVKPINIICITDGAPSDDVESPLVNAAKKLDHLDAPAWQVGVQFFQVGTDTRAKAHLQSLDDNLAELAGVDELRDIVDTVPFTSNEGAQLSGDGILKVVLGAVNRRLDRNGSTNLHRKRA